MSISRLKKSSGRLRLISGHQKFTSGFWITHVRMCSIGDTMGLIQPGVGGSSSGYGLEDRSFDIVYREELSALWCVRLTSHLFQLTVSVSDYTHSIYGFDDALEPCAGAQISTDAA